MARAEGYKNILKTSVEVVTERKMKLFMEDFAKEIDEIIEASLKSDKPLKIDLLIFQL
ncbi:hypothetical protein [Flavobacterium cerinum]|uniref:Uncharacterized protein n=1 Tax=Flavobacterium cerinum TaxID=2502784 RepID=A0ABY5J081_9FLAO|nr:hypothetical protein [Flavobacterium cerinum]UUC47166.1 hypothetical protein NOX80_08195 [Flavobacterium cerinum]